MHALRRLQESNAHEFPTPKSFFAAKYFEVVDMAHERLNERLCNIIKRIQKMNFQMSLKIVVTIFSYL